MQIAGRLLGALPIGSGGKSQRALARRACVVEEKADGCRSQEPEVRRAHQRFSGNFDGVRWSAGCARAFCQVQEECGAETGAHEHPRECQTRKRPTKENRKGDDAENGK